MSGRVLIIENEPWLGEHFERVLERADFDVVRAPNAYTAIDMINENPPNVICMSLLLSGANGLNLLHELQSYADTAVIPVIVWSDRSTALQLDDLRPYGVISILDTASLLPDDIPAAVRSALA